MKFVKTTKGLFIVPLWYSSKNNKRQTELIALVWQIKFENELRATSNRVYKLRRKLIGK